MNVSVIIPAHNEQDNVSRLFDELKEVYSSSAHSYETIFVDDGSTDKTLENLLKIKSENPYVKIIRFKKNFGQTAALTAGFAHATGDAFVTLDSDLQNDPADIPALLRELEAGWDIVSGWRKYRKDPVAKKIISAGANILRKLLFKDNIHDSGCTLKAYKAESVRDLDLYGEMHRFIPAIAESKGFKITEVPVNHRERLSGTTHYHIGRILKGFMDMLIVSFWMHYGTRPAHLIGGLGFFSFFIGLLLAVWLSFEKIALGTPLSDRPLLLFAVLLIIFGTQFIMFGFLADIMMKVYYRAKDAPPYLIDKIIK